MKRMYNTIFYRVRVTTNDNTHHETKMINYLERALNDLRNRVRIYQITNQTDHYRKKTLGVNLFAVHQVRFLDFVDAGNDMLNGG